MQSEHYNSMAAFIGETVTNSPPFPRVYGMRHRINPVSFYFELKRNYGDSLSYQDDCHLFIETSEVFFLR